MLGDQFIELSIKKLETKVKQTLKFNIKENETIISDSETKNLQKILSDLKIPFNQTKNQFNIKNSDLIKLLSN